MKTKSGRARLLLGTFATFLCIVIGVALLTFFDVPQGFRSHVYWILWSREYKRKVFATPNDSTGLQHVEWDGDGWGGASVGDWTGYVVYDQSDSLPIVGTKWAPKKIAGVPCAVVAVRRLERRWFSVVTDMNEFWDNKHPHC